MKRYSFDPAEHVHTLDGKPLIGTSSVMGVVSKPLSFWAAELAAVECLEAGERIATIREEYEAACQSGNKKAAIDALQKKYPIFRKARFAHYAAKDKAADKGTGMHAELEGYVKAWMAGNGLPTVTDKAVRCFHDWATAHVKRFLWSELHTYSEKHWLGGITDAGAELKNGSIALIDFKSAKEAYPAQFWQIGGYDIQLQENGGFTADGTPKLGPLKVDCHIVFPFGAEIPEAQVRYDVESDREAFLAALVLHKKQQEIKHT